MSWIAPYLIGRIPVAALANPPALVELFAETIVEELDFRLEADNMLDVAARPGRHRPAVGGRAPAPPRRWSPAGCWSWSASAGSPSTTSTGMQAAGIDTEAVVRALMIVFLEGATLFGVFHGDLHGGNLFVRADGTRGAARLRHHRPPRRAPPAGLPPHADGRHHQRPQAAARPPSATSAPCRPTPTSTP